MLQIADKITAYIFALSTERENLLIKKISFIENNNLCPIQNTECNKLIDDRIKVIDVELAKYLLP